MLRLYKLLPLAALGISSCSWQNAAQNNASSLAALRQERAKLAVRRRVIFDNDGMDAQFLEEHTPQALLEVRTSQLPGSGVSTVFYCSRSSGLGVFTHDTKVGEVFRSRVGRYHLNATADFIAQGTDPLRIVTDFCKKNELEVFWTLRVNDCHDVIHRRENPYPAFSRLKAAHPEWLMGTYDKRPPHGRWSAYDFAVPEVRTLVVDCVAEVCANYNVDGIHLDFFRHLNYFRSVAQGGVATKEELALTTQMMRRVRQTTEQAGLARGRPFLVAVRVPDCPDYCRALGLDVETWLQEGLVDILVAGEFQLRPWADSVTLGHKHGVQVVAGLSEGRARGELPPYSRQSEESYRGRAAAAWAAGCDGVYLFNLYKAERPFLSEIQDPEKLRTLEQHLFLTTRANTTAGRDLKDGLRFARRPMLTPAHVWTGLQQEGREAVFEVGDPAGRPARLLARFEDARARPRIIFENKELQALDQAEGGWQAFAVPAGMLRPGMNRFEIRISETGMLKRTFTPRQILDTWNLRGTNHGANIREECSADGLLIADTGTGQGEYCYRAYAWSVRPGGRAAATVRVQHREGWSSIAFANGRNEDRLVFETNRILLRSSGLSFDMNTTDSAHTYRVEIEENNVRVFVDGALRIDGPGAYTGKASVGRTMVLLGASTSGTIGTSIWGNVTLETYDTALHDLLLVLPPTAAIDSGRAAAK